MRFTGKVALITAAGRGIGRATAEIIGREGGTVVAVDNDKAALEQVLGAIRGAGGTAHGRTADALDAFQAKDVVRSTLETHGRIDILRRRRQHDHRQAGGGGRADLKEWQQPLISTDGTFLFLNAVVPIMKRQRAGKIVCISSIAGRANRAAAPPPTAKGIIALTKKLSLDWPYGINVNAIARVTLSPPCSRAGRCGPEKKPRTPRFRCAGWPSPRIRRASSAFWPAATPTSSPV
jgi:3-oxoacyl-[acyl-carrier protein] reductase